MWPYQSMGRTPLILPFDRWHGENFLETARDVRLGGSMLYADLKSSEGTWKASSIDLNVVIGNKDGQLVNGTTQWKPAVAQC